MRRVIFILAACAAAIAIAQFNRTPDIHLYTDSAFVVSIYEKLVQAYFPHGNASFCPPVREDLRFEKHTSHRTPIIRMLQELIVNRWKVGHNTFIQKVHAHLSARQTS